MMETAGGQAGDDTAQREFDNPGDLVRFDIADDNQGKAKRLRDEPELCCNSPRLQPSYYVGACQRFFVRFMSTIRKPNFVWVLVPL